MVESNSKIKYDMSQAWWQKASAIEDVSIALDCTEEHRKAFDDPAFTASWGRGSPRPEIFNVRLPHVQQPQQQGKAMGRGRGKLLAMAADNFPPSPKNDFVPTKDDRMRALQQNRSSPPIKKFNSSLQFVENAFYKKPPNQQESSTSVQNCVYDMKEDFPALR